MEIFGSKKWILTACSMCKNSLPLRPLFRCFLWSSCLCIMFTPYTNQLRAGLIYGKRKYFFEDCTDMFGSRDGLPFEQRNGEESERWRSFHFSCGIKLCRKLFSEMMMFAECGGGLSIEVDHNYVRIVCVWLLIVSSAPNHICLQSIIARN